jgi:ferredoxin
MKITVDTSLCRGHAQCEDVAPSIFGLDDTGIVVLLNASPDESQRRKAEEAARLCPERCIVVSD